MGRSVIFMRIKCGSISLALLAAGWIGVSAGPASSQGLFRPVQSTSSAQFLNAPRDVRQHLREAERAIAEQRYSDAVVRLGDLLQRERGGDERETSAGQDYFLASEDGRSQSGRRSRSLLQRAREMIGQLPEAALETYELRYGPLARKTLTDAAEQRQWDAVREVRRKYFHTTAGYQASYLLAQHQWLQGHPLAASILLDEVVTTPRAVQILGPSVQVFHATACRLAGREVPEVAVAGEQLRVGGETAPWPSGDDLTAWIDEHYGSAVTSVVEPLQQYAMLGGDGDRNGGAAGQMPLSRPRWMLETTASPRQERTLREKASELATGGNLPPPTWMPLRVGPQLLMRTTERLIGVDYRTGKRVWQYPWFSSPPPAAEEVELESIGREEDEDPSELLTQRVWNDLPYGQITSDGQRAFLIQDLGEVEVVSFRPFGRPAGGPEESSSNTLVALDLATEGKLLWRVGAGEEASSSLSDAFFLGPPLPLGDRLYVMAELVGEIALICLDAATGEELWRQQLVAVETGSVASDPVRRVAGAMPTYHEGLLICPTGAGATVAIDLADRMLRWGVQYERNRELAHSVTRGGAEVDTSALMRRWHHGAAVASGTSLLITPVETDRLFCFDALSGQQRFPEQSRIHARYLAGIRGDRYFVVGTDQMRAFDLQTGEPVWATSRELVAPGQQISGRGVFGDGEYLLPTSSNELIRVSLQDGSVRQRRATRYPLGNLVAVDGQVISQSPTTLAVAYGEAALEPVVNAMLERDPNNFEALVRKSELLIQHGKRTEALELLAKARQLQPDNDEVHLLSVSAMLGTFRENLDVEGEVVAALDRLIDQPAQRAEFLSLRIRAALADDRLEEATEHLIALSRLLVGEPTWPEAADVIVDDAARQCSLDSWVRARVVEVVSRASDAQLEAIAGAVREAFEPMRDASARTLSQVMRHLGPLQAAEPLRAELAKRYLAEGNYLALERLSLGSAAPTVAGLETLSEPRLLTLGQAYALGGAPEDARKVLEILRGRGATELADRLEAMPQPGDAGVPLASWPEAVSLQWETTRIAAGRARLMSSQRFSQTSRLAGEHFRGWRLMSEGPSSMALMDPLGQTHSIVVPGLDRRDSGEKEARISGGVLVVVMPSEVIAVDLFRVLSGEGDSVLWRRPLGADQQPVAKRRSESTEFGDQVYRYRINSPVAQASRPELRVGPIMGDRLLILQGGDLICLDLMTAEQLWRNADAPASGAVVSDGRRVAVVSETSRRIDTFDLWDGRKLESKPWDGGERWTAVGRHLLCYAPAASTEPGQPRRYQIRLVDPINGTTVLQCDSWPASRSDEPVPAAFGRVVDGRLFCLLDTDGTARVWDLVRGSEVAQVELPAHDDLVGLHACRLDQHLILLPKRRDTGNEAEAGTAVQTTRGQNHQETHGAFAIDLDDGTLAWSREFDSAWGCTLSQPAETPLLLFSRSRSIFASTPHRRRELDVMALDVRDGQTRSRRLAKQVSSHTGAIETWVTVQPAAERVVCQIGLERLTFQFQRSGEDSGDEAADAAE